MISRGEGIRTYSLDIPPEKVYPVLLESYISVVREKNPSLEFEVSEETKDKIASVAKWLTQDDTSGLLLYGKYGTGKSTMLKAIMYTLRNAGKKPSLITAKNLNRSYYYGEIKKSKDVVLIDEFGREQDEVRICGNIVEPTIELLCFREENNMPTVLVSNLTDDELIDKYNMFVVDRINGSYSRIFYEEDSFRELNKKLKQNQKK